jgi:hypothetical protein
VNESTKRARRAPTPLTSPSGPARPRKPSVKTYGAKSVYTETAYEREKRERREAK